MVAFAGGESVVSIYRMDTLHLSGPTTRMLRQTRGTALHDEMRRYAQNLGPVLSDGSLVEWLILSGRDEELQTLLSVRPSASLFLLPRDSKDPSCLRRTPFQLAILTRRDKALAHLLAAAAAFAHHGEPFLDRSDRGMRPARRRRLNHVQSMHGLQQSKKHNSHQCERLLPPALRYVTACIRDALRSEDLHMEEVVMEFLSSLELVDLRLPEQLLPRVQVRVAA